MWLGNALYPEAFDFDAAARAAEFFSLFFDSDEAGESYSEGIAESREAFAEMTIEVTGPAEGQQAYVLPHQ